VATVSATICRALGINADLAWAIGLGHDLGHTPFGHLGEKIIGSLLKEKNGFRHEIYSLRVVDHLAGYGKGLNLTYAVRDGILNHCGEKFEQKITPDFTLKNLSTIKTRDFYPSTYEGVVVRMSDKVAYMGRDLEDAIQLGVIKADELPGSVKKYLGSNNSDIINTLVQDLIETSLKTGEIGYSDDVFEQTLLLKEFNYKHIYLDPKLTTYHDYFERILLSLFEYLSELIQKFGNETDKYAAEKNYLGQRFGDFLKKMQNFYESENAAPADMVIDYLAGMTDDYAINCAQEILLPQAFKVQFDTLPGME